MNLFQPSPRPVFGRSRRRNAFTMIEIIIVVALLGLFCTMAIPSIYQLSRKTGLRRAISDLRDVCANARARAIFTGKEVTVMFYPLERKFGISGSAPTAAPADAGGESRPTMGAEVTPGTEVNGIIPEDVSLEMLDVNQSEYKDSEWTRVRFFPNGTCDELTVVYVSEDGEFRKLWLEPTTGLLNQGKMR